MTYHNGDLRMDIEGIKRICKSLNTNGYIIALEQSEDHNLDYPYGIDVEDTSYWYADKNERDDDYAELESDLQQL